MIEGNPETLSRISIWDGDACQAPAGEGDLLSWNEPTPGGRGRLILDYLEANSDVIRARYLAWVHELGELSIDGTPMRRHFAFADGPDPWAMSVFVEQSPWRQASVEPILKVMAFELMIERETVRQVSYQGADAALCQVLRTLCARRGIPFDALVRGQRVAARTTLRQRLPQALQAALGVVWLAATRLPLRVISNPAANSARRVVICAPYFNHNARDAGVRDFESKFWTVLPAALEDGGYAITWLHSFYAHDATPDVATAQRQIARQNDSRGARGTHLLLESFLTVGGLLRITRWLCATAVRALRAEKELRAKVACWPLMQGDWAKAFRGAGCLENLMYAECYDRAFARLPRQDEGLHLMECQGWERALAHAWRRRRQGRLAGSIHSTIRYWDLRYHADPRRYPGGASTLPAPDVVVANGLQAVRQYLSTVQVREPVYEAEALRYLHFAKPPTIAAGDSSVKLRLLVVGDYLREGTDAVMRLVEAACASNDPPVEVRVKPHPNCPVEPSRFPALPFEVVSGDVPTLAREAHIVISGNLTSAAVDAHVVGARVWVVDERRGINYSPLRGVAGVLFIRDVAELRSALASFRAGANHAGTEDFFHVDTGLARWRQYFGIGNSLQRVVNQ